MNRTRLINGISVKHHPAKSVLENLIAFGFADTPDTVARILDRWQNHRANRELLDTDEPEHLNTEFHAALEAGDVKKARALVQAQAVADTLTKWDDHVSKQEDVYAAELTREVRTWIKAEIIPNLYATFNHHAAELTSIVDAVGQPVTSATLLNSPGGAEQYAELINHGAALNKCVQGINFLETEYGSKFGNRLSLYTPAMPSRWHYKDVEERAKRIETDEPLATVAFWLAALEAPTIPGTDKPRLGIMESSTREAHQKLMSRTASPFLKQGVRDVRQAVMNSYRKGN